MNELLRWRLWVLLEERTDWQRQDRKEQEERGVEDAQGHKLRALSATHWKLTLNLKEH